jgi:hypothetical protein
MHRLWSFLALPLPFPPASDTIGMFSSMMRQTSSTSTSPRSSTPPTLSISRRTIPSYLRPSCSRGMRSCMRSTSKLKPNPNHLSRSNPLFLPQVRLPSISPTSPSLPARTLRHILPHQQRLNPHHHDHHCHHPPLLPHYPLLLHRPSSLALPSLSSVPLSPVHIQLPLGTRPLGRLTRRTSISLVAEGTSRSSRGSGKRKSRRLRRRKGVERRRMTGEGLPAGGTGGEA